MTGPAQPPSVLRTWASWLADARASVAAVVERNAGSVAPDPP